MLLNTASSCLSNGKSRDLIFPVIFASPVNGQGLDLWDTHLTWIVNKVWEVLEEKTIVWFETMNSTDSLPDLWNSNWKLKNWKINYMIFVTNMHVLMKYDQIVCIILL